MVLSVRRAIIAVFVAAVTVCASAQGTTTFSLMRCTKAPLPMYKNGAAVVGKRLYLIGGRLQKLGWTKKVYYTDIRPDGSLTGFKEERPLPEFRVYIGNSVEVVNDRIYVVAGSIPVAYNVPDSDSRLANDVLWARVQSDGMLSEWKHSTPYPGDPVTCAATCSSDKQLFVLGGQNRGGAGSDRVLVADFDAEGALTNWRQERRLPVPLWFLQATMLEDRIYVWGGLKDNSTSSTPTPEAYSAKVDQDGRISEWQRETPLPRPFYSSVYCGLNDFLISAGGLYAGGIPSFEIWYNRLENGRMTKWVPLTADFELAAFRSMGFDKERGTVYIIGGLRRDMKGQGPGTGLDAVQAFRLPQPKTSKLTAASGGTQSQKFASLDEALQSGKEKGNYVMRCSGLFRHLIY